MFAVAVQRVLLICLALLVMTLCAPPRGQQGLAMQAIAVQAAEGSGDQRAVDDSGCEPGPLDSTSLVATPDLPDDTHAAALWCWSSVLHPHALIQAVPEPGDHAGITTLLRPPSA